MFPFAENDKKILEDPILVDLIGLLANFAGFDRYYDMDCIGGDNKVKNGARKLPPEDKWGKLELKLIEEQHPEWFKDNDVTRKISLEFVKLLE